MSTNMVSCDFYNQNKCDLSVSECSNCVLLDNQLHSALQELESAKLIVKLLQKESDEDFPHGDRNSAAINSSRDKSALVQSNRLENNKWTVIKAKCRRKGFSDRLLSCDSKMAASVTAIRDCVISVTRWCDVTEMTQ